MTCGTTRWVTLANAESSSGIACRWCHHRARWGEAAPRLRASAVAYRPIRGEEWVREQLDVMGLTALTEVGDEFDPVGVICRTCGETTYVLPERFVPERGWNGCQRCSEARKKGVKADADSLFADHGLTLVGPCSGEFVKQTCVCQKCGSERRVSYNDLKQGTAPLCWTCTHGIRRDEPHRVYLVHFPDLGVYKVGITHNRHDRRLQDHLAARCQILETIVVPDRRAALDLEKFILQRTSQWKADGIGPNDFEQGGWTETWLDSGPRIDLEGEAGQLGVSVIV